MTNEVMSNEDFYRDTATVLMAAYNEDPSTADEKGLALVNARFEDSAERKHAIDKISRIVADEFKEAVDAAQEVVDMEPTEQLPLDLDASDAE